MYYVLSSCCVVCVLSVYGTCTVMFVLGALRYRTVPYLLPSSSLLRPSSRCLVVRMLDFNQQHNVWDLVTYYLQNPNPASTKMCQRIEYVWSVVPAAAALLQPTLHDY